MLTTTGLIVAVLLMALLTAINFLGIKKLAATNSAATWWKVAVPLLAILVLAIANFDTSNFTAANGFSPDGLHGILAAVSTSGIIFSYLGFEQADQLAGEAKNPKRDVPFAIIGSMVIGTSSTSRCRSPSSSPCPTSAIGKTWDHGRQGPLHRRSPVRSRRSRRCSASAGWPRSSTPTRSSAPAGTGLIYTTGSSRVAYGLSRNGYVPTPFEWTNERGVPWVGLIAAFVTGCICFLPFPSWQSLVGLITSASRPDVRRRAALARAPSGAGCRTPTGPTGCPRRGSCRRWRSSSPNLIILWTGWDTDLEARRRRS